MSPAKSNRALNLRSLTALFHFAGCATIASRLFASACHHRTGSRAGIRNVARADLSQPRREICDECEHRLAHRALVARLVLREPVAIVVAAQFLQKFEKSLCKVALGHRFRFTPG